MPFSHGLFSHANKKGPWIYLIIFFFSDHKNINSLQL